MSECWKYLYAIGPADEASALDMASFEDSGLNGSAVEVVTRGKLAADVSDVPAKRVRPVRKRKPARLGR